MGKTVGPLTVHMWCENLKLTMQKSEVMNETTKTKNPKVVNDLNRPN